MAHLSSLSLQEANSWDILRQAILFGTTMAMSVLLQTRSVWICTKSASAVWLKFYAKAVRVVPDFNSLLET